MRIHLMALCFGLALTPGAAVTAHANYTAIVLPDLGGASDSAVEAINSVGESVGYSVTPSGGLDAVLWSADGDTGTVLLDKGGQGKSNAFAINASGESVGQTVTATGEDAVLWSSSGTKATVLGKGGGIGTAAVAINGTGESVGYVTARTPYCGTRRGRGHCLVTRARSISRKRSP